MLDIITTLEKLGVIEKFGDQIIVKITSLRLPKNAQIYEQWRHQVRFLSMQKMQSLEKKDQYSFSVTISAENDFLDVVRERFGSFLKDMEHQVSNASCEKVFQVNFEAHSWI